MSNQVVFQKSLKIMDTNFKPHIYTHTHTYMLTHHIFTSQLKYTLWSLIKRFTIRSQDVCVVWLLVITVISSNHPHLSLSLHFSIAGFYWMSFALSEHWRFYDTEECKIRKNELCARFQSHLETVTDSINCSCDTDYFWFLEKLSDISCKMKI